IPPLPAVLLPAARGDVARRSHTRKFASWFEPNGALLPCVRPKVILGSAWKVRSGRYEMAEFVSIYGIWVVAAFIALESVGIPVPAEAVLIAAAFFAARNHGLDIWALIGTAIVAAIIGEIVGFWIGRRFGHQLLTRYGTRLGMTEGRIRIGQWLFVHYGGR